MLWLVQTQTIICMWLAVIGTNSPPLAIEKQAILAKGLKDTRPLLVPSFHVAVLGPIKASLE